jgi:Ni,Fe-hydrogenase maturation factor
MSTYDNPRLVRTLGKLIDADNVLPLNYAACCEGEPDHRHELVQKVEKDIHKSIKNILQVIGESYRE